MLNFLKRHLSKEGVQVFILKEKYFLLFLFFAFFFFLIKGMLLIYPDLNITYPFMFPDSYDWIANGLHYAGYDVNFTTRAPGLPLLIAALVKLGKSNLLPLSNQFILFGIYILFYKILRTAFNRSASLITIFILFFNFFLQDLSLYILADMYALLFILIGIFYYIRSAEKENLYIYASLFWSISFLFQYTIVFIVPIIIIHFLIFRKKISKKLLIYVILPPFLIISAWLIYREIKFGSFFYTGVDQIALMKFHLDSIFFYLVNMVSLLGIFSFCMFIAGIFITYLNWRNKKIPKKTANLIIFNTLALAAWFSFWVLLYNWNDRRFIIYLLPFLIFFIAATIDYLLSAFYEYNVSVKIFVVAIILLGIAYSNIPYESALSFDILKITRLTEIKFKAVLDQKSFKGNIAPLSAQIIRKSPSFINPLNLKSLYSIRKNANFNELAQLDKLEENIVSEKKTSICIEYIKTEFNGAKWYIDNNRYGNYFRKKVILYPECNSPDLTL
jgi:4-amino-4-deoxy-L-arabinose transferase-like glycosyltransferase